MRVFSFNNLFLGTASKKYTKNAQKEIKNLDPECKIIDRFPDGVFSFSISKDKSSFQKALRENRPVFLRHITPIDRVVFLENMRQAPAIVSKETTSLLTEKSLHKKIAVQARRIPGDYDFSLYSFKSAIDPILIEHKLGKPVVKNPDQIISIFIADSTLIDHQVSITCSETHCQISLPPWTGIAMMGLSTPQDNLCEWSGGIVRFSKEEEQVSRAEFKLLEAFEVFQLKDLHCEKALDLGASPGGWTRVLAEMGCKVTAVDRAPLDPAIQKLKGVRFIKKDAVHFRDEKETYDIIVNDMNRDPQQSAKAVIIVSETLKHNGLLIMTIKLQGKSSEKLIAKTLDTLKESFEILSVRQLYHNRDEVTVYGVKSAK